jgi:hypothetical protein
MTDRPIIFSAPMVRALLDGRKTQTRRVLKPQAAAGAYRLATYDPKGKAFFASDDTGKLERVRIPFAPGDRLYVREAHALVPSSAYRASEGVQQTVDPSDRYRACIYREGFDRSNGGFLWRPSIHMPRWASRLTLTVTEVRVEQLQDISAEDCTAEGIPFESDALAPAEWSISRFADLWNSIHGPDAWDANPWVVAVSFTVRKSNIDTQETAND